MCPSIVSIYGRHGSFRYPPRVQSASMLAGPETCICFSLTSDRSGSNKMVSAFRYLLRPVTSFVGSTNLQRTNELLPTHCHVPCAVANSRQAALQTGMASSGTAFACSHQQTPLGLDFQLRNTGLQQDPFSKHPAAELFLKLCGSAL